MRIRNQIITSGPVVIVAIAFMAVFLTLSFKGSLATVSADTAADIQAKIDTNNQKIAQLQQEIDRYSGLLTSSSRQAQTLTNALRSLELTQKKLEADLALTDSKISKTGLTIQQLTKQIGTTQIQIGSTSAAVAQTIRDTEAAEAQSPVEDFLNNKSMSDAWDYINQVQSLQESVKNKYDDLKNLQDALHVKEARAAGQKADLEAYMRNLSGQQQALQASQDEKAKLLSDTKNKEASYQQILAQKQQEELAYEKELFTYESQLKETALPGSVPQAAHGLLSWPLDNIFVTQYFGATVSAKRLYVSGTHGGVDFRATIGTPIKAAMDGLVKDTEPTKYRSGCQYGKFVLLDHADGLSTIYGHLSSVIVKPGDTVTAGEVIGYSGDTGYSMGPHLHFGLYVTSAIRIVDSSNLGSTHCAGIKTVAAPPADYLDPMAYLPSYSQ